jgi:heme/copper-type cytochrome/quinol oxidase subunit 2
MRRIHKLKLPAALVAIAAAFHSQSVFACAACFGKSDSPLASGMNWGIFSLLAVVVCVLGGIASFFVYLARKSAAVAATRAPQTELQQSTQPT